MIQILKGDITTLEVDAIVNAANEALRGGGGVDGAIHRAAGRELLEECRKHPGCPTGAAVLTHGYRLPAKFVIHVVGPIWNGGGGGEERLLRSAYDSAFRIALENGSIRSIAFPAVSTGVYRFPKERAARIAIEAMRANESHFERIVACLFDDANLAAYEKGLAR